MVLITPSLPGECLRALDIECKHNPLLSVHPVDLLLPSSPVSIADARFKETWTKLRAFELTNYDICVFLDADVIIRKNSDEIFDIDLPGSDWIAANHRCVCDLDHDTYWNPEICAYTVLDHLFALEGGTPVPQDEIPPHTYCLLKSGVFLYRPSPALWDAMLECFNTSKELSTFQFPDQDFLDRFFSHKWRPISWKYNAIKTMKEWHPNIWRAEALHYIKDKSWERRVASDGLGGHLGRDGETHGWWWDIWEEWTQAREDDDELLTIMEKMVAKPLDEKGDKRQCEENRNLGYPTPVPDSPATKRARQTADAESSHGSKTGKAQSDMVVDDRTSADDTSGPAFSSLSSATAW